MANLTSVTLTAGVPTAGTGTVGTIDNVTGTAGTPSTAVLTVQGVTSGTPAPASLSSTAATAGGLTVSSTLIASGTNATSVKASSGQLYKIEVFNNSSVPGYLKVYNSATAPTAGSGTPVIRVLVPANNNTNSIGAGAISCSETGVAFSAGIGFTFTGGIADADTTSVTASSFIVNLYYK